MTSLEEANEAALADLCDLGIEARKAWEMYCAWCTANDAQPFPPEGADADAGADALLKFLMSNVLERGWCAANVRQVGGAIARQFIRAGHPDPRTKQYSLLIRHRSKTDGHLRHEIDGFSRAEVLAMPTAVARAAVTMSKEVRVAAGLVALADLRSGGLPGSRIFPISMLANVSIENRGQELVVRSPAGEPVVVSAGSTPYHFRALMRMVGDGERSTLIDVPPNRVLSRVKSAASWASGDLPLRSSVQAFAEWWAAADASRTSMLAWLENPYFERDACDLAYFYVGLGFGARHAELKRLRMRHLVPIRDGWRVQLPAHEHKGGKLALHHGGKGEALVHDIIHVGEYPHPPQCPACLLQTHLTHRAQRGPLEPESHLFVSQRGRQTVVRPGENAEMSITAGAEIIRRLYGKVRAYLGPDEEGRPRRLGTRSIRVTAATLAKSEGMALAEISELIGHRQLSTTSLYLRVHDEYAESDLVLSL